MTPSLERAKGPSTADGRASEQPYVLNSRSSYDGLVNRSRACGPLAERRRIRRARSPSPLTTDGHGDAGKCCRSMAHELRVGGTARRVRWRRAHVTRQLCPASQMRNGTQKTQSRPGRTFYVPGLEPSPGLWLIVRSSLPLAVHPCVRLTSHSQQGTPALPRVVRSARVVCRNPGGHPVPWSTASWLLSAVAALPPVAGVGGGLRDGPWTPNPVCSRRSGAKLLPARASIRRSGSSAEVPRRCESVTNYC